MSECAAQLLRTVCMEVDTVTPKTEKEHLNNDDTVIPMLELRGEIDEIWAEISTAVHRVLRRGQFVSGPEVETFEAEVAAYLGVDHAVGVNSGTDALLIALRSAGIGPGDEVITTPFTFFATVEAIVLAGATPVFVDIGWDGFNIDVGSIEQAVTEHTRAVLPVHLFGDPVEMGSLRELCRTNGLRLVEDCAQAFGATYSRDAEGRVPAGARVGSGGDVAAFSFYPTKNLGAYGDGG